MLEISTLKAKSLAELKELAKTMKVPKHSQLNKLDLVYKILDFQAANPKEEEKIASQPIAKRENPQQKPVKNNLKNRLKNRKKTNQAQLRKACQTKLRKTYSKTQLPKKTATPKGTYRKKYRENDC